MVWIFFLTLIFAFSSFFFPSRSFPPLGAVPSIGVFSVSVFFRFLKSGFAYFPTFMRADMHFGKAQMSVLGGGPKLGYYPLTLDSGYEYSIMTHPMHPIGTVA